MLNLLAVQNSQRHGYTHAVIGPQGGAASLEPTVLNVSLNGLGHEIVVQGGILLADHILVRLQNHRLPALKSGSCGLGNEHVTNLILLCGKPACGCERHKVLTHFLLTARWTRNPADFQENIHHSLRPIYLFHIYFNKL